MSVKTAIPALVDEAAICDFPETIEQFQLPACPGFPETVTTKHPMKTVQKNTITQASERQIKNLS
jgi:hypothetical protein